MEWTIRYAIASQAGREETFTYSCLACCSSSEEATASLFYLLDRHAHRVVNTPPLQGFAPCRGGTEAGEHRVTDGRSR
jgi:hypothetical protein